MTARLSLITATMFTLATAALAQDEFALYSPFMPEGKPLEGLVITLDPGHGGSTHQAGYAGSARGTSSRVVEGDLNMLVAAELRWHLEHAGAKVHMTRWDDRRVTLNPAEGEPTGRDDELGARVEVARKTQSHLFLSLHHNSTGRETADGVVVLIWPTDSKGKEQPLETAFANIIEEEVRKQVPNKEDFNHYVNEHPLVSFSDIPSAVIEFGFLSNPDFDAWVSQPGSHLTEAEGAYNAVLRMWEENRDALDAKRQELFPDAKKVQAAKENPHEAAALAKSLWPFEEPPGTEKEANWLLAQYKRTLNDSTFFYLDATVTTSGYEWVVEGSTNHTIIREAVGELLEGAGLSNIANRLEVLPSNELGDEIYGIVQIPMALTWGEPEEGANVQTQVLLGEPLFILDVNDDQAFYLVHGHDSYIGWVRREAVRRMNRAQFEEWTSQKTGRLRHDYLVDDFRLPAGAILPTGDVSATTVTLTIPRGVRATKNEVTVQVPREVMFIYPGGKGGNLAATAAKEFLGTPYVFGGRSKLGLDCSGLISASYATIGLTLARDARQQIIHGSLVATASHPAPLRPGDTIYFLDGSGRVFHTAMSLGGSRFIHSSPPHVHVLSMDPHDPLYDEFWTSRFAFARRPLDP